MSTIQVGKSASGQLKAGAAILAAAQTTDTRLIKDRLAAFDRAQQGYANAYATLQEAQADLETAQAQFRTEQQGVVDALARALVADGQPLRNPFAGFGAATVSTFMHLPPDAAVKELPQLIATLRRSKTLGKLTLQALPAAEKATRALDQALARMDGLRTAAHNARATRDAVAQKWEAAFAALKRGARSAADDGAPTLYATLFDRPGRTNGKNNKPGTVSSATADRNAGAEPDAHNLTPRRKPTAARLGAVGPCRIPPHDSAGARANSAAAPAGAHRRLASIRKKRGNRRCTPMNVDVEFDAIHRLITKCIAMRFTALSSLCRSSDRRASAVPSHFRFGVSSLFSR